jgi:hypothetical protein
MITAIVVAIIGVIGAVAAAAVGGLIQTGQLQAYLKTISERQRQAAAHEKERVAVKPPAAVQHVITAVFVAFVSYLLFFIGSIVAMECCAPPTALAGDPVPLAGGAAGGIIGFAGAVALVIRNAKSSRRQKSE